MPARISPCSARSQRSCCEHAPAPIHLSRTACGQAAKPGRRALFSRCCSVFRDMTHLAGGRSWRCRRSIMADACGCIGACSIPGHCVVPRWSPRPARRSSRSRRRRAFRAPCSLGVALDKWPAMPPRRAPTKTRCGPIHVASLNPVKDQRTLLRAIRLLRDAGHVFRLDIVVKIPCTARYRHWESNWDCGIRFGSTGS